MKIFSIYEHKSKKIEDLKVVKSGFAIIPAFFNFFWALYHRMWGVVLPIITITLAIQYYGSNKIMDLFQYSQIILFFLFSEELLIYSFEKKGYELTDVIYASNQEEAIYKYLKRKERNNEL